MVELWPCCNVMSGQVLAVFSGIFASLASIFSKLALSNDVHALDRRVLGTLCTTEDNEECFPVRTVNTELLIPIHLCMHTGCMHVCGHARPYVSMKHALLRHLYPLCAGVCPAARSNAVSYAREQRSDADYVCKGNAEVQLHC